jgi:hypothetical protein
MFPTEVRSLEAIKELEQEFPYAATLLIYVVIERCLKLYLLENRQNLTDAEVDLERCVGRKRQRLSDVRGLNDKSFIDNFLVNCPLGALETIYRIPGGRYSHSRNGVFHSDLFLRHQVGSDDTSRNKANQEHLKEAKKHLIEASERYFHQKITDSNGLLQFES